MRYIETRWFHVSFIISHNSVLNNILALYSISLNFGVPRHSGLAGAICARLVLIAGARWRILRNVNVRIIWERAAYSRTTREPEGRVPRILREFLYSSDGCPPSSCLPLRANDFVASGIPRPPFPLPSPLLSDERRRLRFRWTCSSSAAPFIPPPNRPSSFFNSTSRRDFPFLFPRG